MMGSEHGVRAHLRQTCTKAESLAGTGRSGSTLTGHSVNQVMRRKVVKLPEKESIEEALRTMIRHRINGILVEDGDGQPVGVLSRSDILGAYYAELPITMAIEAVMSRPVLACQAEDTLEAALDRMQQHRVTRLFVMEEGREQAVGVLTLPDVVGLLYRHCHYCSKSLFKGAYISQETSKAILRFTVGDIMGRKVIRLDQRATLAQCLERLAMAGVGEVLVAAQDGDGLGVVSVQDLVLAYRHGQPLATTVEQIMTSPIRTCREDHSLEEAIRTMIFSDLGCLFVQDRQGQGTVGLLTLADAARARSGSCRACMVSRLTA